jgi:putative DNA primase/helicase
VREATDEYIKSQNTVGNWIEERCDTGHGLKAMSNELYADFRSWAHSCGEESLKQTDFNKALEDLRYSIKRAKIGMVWDGLKLRGVAPNGLDP